MTSGYKSSSWIPEGAWVIQEDSPLPVASGQKLAGRLSVFGDSHMGQLVPSLREKAQDAGLTFLNGISNSCLFVVGLAAEATQGCDVDLQDARIDAAQNFSPAFTIIGGRYPVALEGVRFDNQEGGLEAGGGYRFFFPGTQDLSHDNMVRQLGESTRRTAKILRDQGNVLVLVYPIPEAGWDVPSEVQLRAFRGESGPRAIREFQDYFSERGIKVQWNKFSFPAEWPLDEAVTTSYDVYVERTRSTFELFDSISGEDVIRIYPHEIFCDDKTGGRCYTHSDTEIWYSDDDHLSVSGAELLSSEIIREVAAWRKTGN